MTEAELEALEERVNHRWRTSAPDAVVSEVVAALLAEIRRLRAEASSK